MHIESKFIHLIHIRTYIHTYIHTGAARTLNQTLFAAIEHVQYVVCMRMCVCVLNVFRRDRARAARGIYVYVCMYVRGIYVYVCVECISLRSRTCSTWYVCICTWYVYVYACIACISRDRARARGMV
jgi:hypothetical protein